MRKPVIFYALIMGLDARVNFSCKDSIIPLPIGNYSVFAWNYLGMHCLNLFNKPVTPPLHNNFFVQSTKHGNPPAIITAELTVTNQTSNKNSHNKYPAADYMPMHLNFLEPLVSWVNPIPNSIRNMEIQIPTDAIHVIPRHQQIPLVGHILSPGKQVKYPFLTLKNMLYENINFYPVKWIYGYFN